MRRLVTFATVAALLVVALPPALATAQSALDEIKQRGELRVAGVLYRPLISPGPTGNTSASTSRS